MWTSILGATRLVLVAVLSLAASAWAAATKPNFLVILTEDQGYSDVSTYGASEVRTPSIDRLAAEERLSSQSSS